MGGMLFKMVAKNGTEPVTTQATSLWQLGAMDIDGQMINSLGSIKGNKCTLVVNVATQ